MYLGTITNPPATYSISTVPQVLEVPLASCTILYGQEHPSRRPCCPGVHTRSQLWHQMTSLSLNGKPGL